MNNNAILENNGAQLVLTTFADMQKYGEYCAEKAIEKFFAGKKETYLTTQQTADMLRVDPSTLFRWHKSGYLSPIRLGGKKLYRMSDIDKITENYSQPLQ